MEAHPKAYAHLQRNRSGAKEKEEEKNKSRNFDTGNNHKIQSISQSKRDVYGFYVGEEGLIKLKTRKREKNKDMG